MGYYTFSPDTVESQYRYHAINSATCKRGNTGNGSEPNNEKEMDALAAARIAVSIREHAWEQRNTSRSSLLRRPAYY